MDTYIYKGGRSDGHIYTIRLSNRPPLKQRGKIRRTHIYTKGEDQTDTYIYYLIEQQDYTKTKGEDHTNIYIYTKVEDLMDTYIY
jgi:hypothetical protein